MFKLSKLLYAIVNQILQVPKQLLDQNNKLDYIINIKDSYPMLNKNSKNKIDQYLGKDI